MVSGAFAQPYSIDTPEDLKNKLMQTRESLFQRAPISCGTDTLYYPLFKGSSSEPKILFSNGTYANAAGQWFPASSSIPFLLKGFKWYGYSTDPTGTTNPVINAVCQIYLAGPDSLPVGNPLASDTLMVDTVTAFAERQVIFQSPVTISANYVVVIKNNSSDLLVYFSNDEDAGDGGNERLSSSFYEPGGYWRKNDALWAQGDWDNLFHPIIQYSIDANFSLSASGCVGIGKTMSNSSVGYFENRFFNSSVAAGNPASYHWDYGDGNTASFQKNGSNTYAAPGNYTVTLFDTLYGWTMTCTDLRSRQIDVFTIPSAPSSTPPAPVCEGTPIGNLTATGSGGTTSWYSNPAPSGLLGTGNPYNSSISIGTTVYVTETVNGCESTPTSVLLSFLANAVPSFSSAPTGGTDISFSTGVSATSYSWDFGDGSPVASGSSTNHSFGSAGPHTVCLTVTYTNGCSREGCETISFVGVEDDPLQQIIVFPNPTNGPLLIQNLMQTDIEILDVAGKRLMTYTSMHNQLEVDLSPYSKGIYFIRFNTSDARRTVRVILQ